MDSLPGTLLLPGYTEPAVPHHVPVMYTAVSVPDGGALGSSSFSPGWTLRAYGCLENVPGSDGVLKIMER